MHQTDEQRAHLAETRMSVIVPAGAMRLAVPAMAMGVEMDGAVGMPMGVEVDSVPPKAVENVPAEARQHQSDADFQPTCKSLKDRRLQKNGAATDEQQS